MTTRPPIIINNKYKLNRLVGKGRFGMVFEGVNIAVSSGGAAGVVAVKLENNTDENDFHTLKHETTVLNYLNSKRCPSIPSIYWYGKFDKYITLVMPYYPGGSLHDRMATIQTNTATGGAGSSSAANGIMQQIIYIIQSVHSFGILHRDIKPQNIMFSTDRLVLIDFGLSIPAPTEDAAADGGDGGRRGLVGTPNYISYFNYEGTPPSKWDDLLSIGYIYMQMTGGLYWETAPEEELPTLKRWDNIKPRVEEGKPIYKYLEYCYCGGGGDGGTTAECHYQLLAELFIAG